jgi:hypothetical protein
MAPAVRKAIFDGEGDAVAWLDEGTLLRGPKIRLSAYPGRVAVDVHVRRVTNTQGKPLKHVWPGPTSGLPEARAPHVGGFGSDPVVLREGGLHVV